MSNAHFVQPEMKFVLVAICKILDQTRTQVHDRLLNWFGEGASIKSGVVKLFRQVN
jgi:hypothetical protein